MSLEPSKSDYYADIEQELDEIEAQRLRVERSLPDKSKKRKVKPRNSRYHKEDNKVSR